jgi:hypothetical protein
MTYASAISTLIASSTTTPSVGRSRISREGVATVSGGEREHNMQGERTDTDGKNWRHAVDGGCFSWDLKVLPRRPQELHVKSGAATPAGAGSTSSRTVNGWPR